MPTLPRLSLVIIALLIWAPFPALAQLPAPEYHDNGQIKTVWEAAADGVSLNRTEFFSNGQLKNKATYREEQLNGLYQEFTAEGKPRLEISYKMGVEHGPFREYFANGNLKSAGEYIEGKLNGIQFIYFQDGKLSQEAVYYNDTLNGEVKIFFPNGQIRQASGYRYGKLWGPFKIYTETGTLNSYREYVDEVLQGPFLTFFDSGILQENGNFRDGQVTDKRVYNEQGILAVDVRFENGLKEGPYSEYYEDGILKIMRTYDDDAVVTERYFDQYGMEVSKEKASLDQQQDPSVEQLMLRAFGQPDFIILVVAIVISILGTAFVVSRYYKSLAATQDLIRPTLKPIEPEEQQPEPQEKDFLDPSSDRMYRGLIENVRSGIYVADADGKLIYANNTFAQLLGYRTKPETAGLNLEDNFSDPYRHENSFMQTLKQANAVYDYSFEYKKADGTDVVLSTSANLIFNDRGEVIGVQGVVQDITKQSQLQETIHTEKRKLEHLMDFFEEIDTIREIDVLHRYIIDGISEILESNRCSLMLVDADTNTLKVAEAIGMDDDIKTATKVGWGEPIAGQVAKEAKPLLIKNIEYDENLKSRKNPTYQGRSLMAAPLIYNEAMVGVLCVTDKKNEILHGEPFTGIDLKILVTIASKVVIALENVKVYNDLNLLTHTDPITQIYNYRLFSQSLEREIARQKREKTNLAIFMMDLDSFKSYNDTYGHLEGDELLKNLGHILKASLRETDIVCRYAGDEFCVVLPDTDAVGGQKAAEKVIAGVRDFPHFKRPVTISIGIAMYEADLDKKTFIKRADAALYDAKHSGKNCVRVFDPAKHKISEDS
ncbi:MAG: diguanylate cyclase [Candidatus Omnitrophica bacterium]|nr:diguanylate cyclase [Candidatus Omnitrophota bacterium]